MARDQLVEPLGRKAEELAIADGVHVEGRRPAAQHESFAHGTAPEVLEDDVTTPVFIDVRSAEPPMRDQHEGNAGLAPLHDACAPSDVDRLEGRVQVVQRLGIQSATDRSPSEETQSLDRRRDRRGGDGPHGPGGNKQASFPVP